MSVPTAEDYREFINAVLDNKREYVTHAFDKAVYDHSIGSLRNLWEIGLRNPSPFIHRIVFPEISYSEKTTRTFSVSPDPPYEDRLVPQEEVKASKQRELKAIESAVKGLKAYKFLSNSVDIDKYLRKLLRHFDAFDKDILRKKPKVWPLDLKLRIFDLYCSLAYCYEQYLIDIEFYEASAPDTAVDYILDEQLKTVKQSSIIQKALPGLPSENFARFSMFEQDYKTKLKSRELFDRSNSSDAEHRLVARITYNLFSWSAFYNKIPMLDLVLERGVLGPDFQNKLAIQDEEQHEHLLQMKSNLETVKQGRKPSMDAFKQPLSIVHGLGSAIANNIYYEEYFRKAFNRQDPADGNLYLETWVSRYSFELVKTDIFEE